MGKFNDFSALKALKKELEKKDPSGKDVAPQSQKRSHKSLSTLLAAVAYATCIRTLLR